MAEDPREVEITGTLTQYTDHREVTRYAEDVKPGHLKQVSDIYIQKTATGADAPDEIHFRFIWRKRAKEKDQDDGEGLF